MKMFLVRFSERSAVNMLQGFLSTATTEEQQRLIKQVEMARKNAFEAGIRDAGLHPSSPKS